MSGVSGVATVLEEPSVARRGSAWPSVAPNLWGSGKLCTCDPLMEGLVVVTLRDMPTLPRVASSFGGPTEPRVCSSRVVTSGWRGVMLHQAAECDVEHSVSALECPVSLNLGSLTLGT